MEQEIKNGTYTIPEGLTAKIEDGKIIVEKKESVDEKIRKELLIDIPKVFPYDKAFKYIAYLEKQKEQQPVECPEKGNGYWFGFNEGKGSVLDHPEEYGLIKPAEWSEEDEKTRNSIIEAIHNLWPYEHRDKCVRWLKSLHPQPKQEWSEEDKGVLLSIKCVIDEIWHSKNNTTDCPNDELEEMWHWLNTLWERVEYPQPHWKPSEEQIDALERAIVKMHAVNDVGILAELRDNLKKL